MREVYAAEDELTFSLDTLADVAMLKTNISPDGQFSTTVPKRTAIRLAGINIPVERVPLFDVEFAAGSIRGSAAASGRLSRARTRAASEPAAGSASAGRLSEPDGRFSIAAKSEFCISGRQRVKCVE